MILKELFVRLGLDLDSSSFAAGQTAADLISRSIMGIARSALDATSALIKMAVGANAATEAAKLRLTGLAQVNLKLPFEEAAAAADELYAGLEQDAAMTPSSTAELVDFGTDIANSYLGAGRSMKQLRDFTTEAVVAAKMLGAEGTAGLDIVQAINGTVGARDRFGKFLVEGVLKMKTDTFNAKSKDERLKLLEKALGDQTFKDAMKAYETSWAGVTSTLVDNATIIARDAGKPLFDFLKNVLGKLGAWVQKNKASIAAFFGGFVKVFGALGRIVYMVVDIIARLIGWFYKAGPVMGTMLTALSALVVAMALFGTESVIAALSSAAAWALAALPVIAIAALIAVAILLIEDIYTGLTGGQSLIFELWAQWKKFMASWLEDKDSDPWWLLMVKQLLRFIFDTDDAWARVVDSWKQVFSDFVEWVKGIFADLWNGIKQGVKDAAKAALNAINPFSGEQGIGTGGVQQFITGAQNIIPAARGNTTIAPSLRVDTVSIQTTGEPEDVASKVRKAMDEQFQIVLRETQKAVAQ